jgi:DNA-binding transcriptional MerR regulator
LSSLSPAKSSQAFRTIAEASDELDVPAHVLRFWEGKFTQIKPLKRAGGRRHYRPDDMALLRGIRALLQEDGYQIKGVQKLLKDQGIAWVRDRGLGQADVAIDSDPIVEPHISLHERTPLAQTVRAGPLFEAADPATTEENISPAAGIMLRKALVKLEKARHLLDYVAKNNSARTNSL